MNVRVLMYHDVIERGQDGASGFPGADAAIYKLEVDQFAAHLKAIAASQTNPPGDITNISQTEKDAGRWMITFDDGGASAHTHIAPMLEEFGWRGYFFITTDFIATPAFLTAAQIRDLHSRGHIIGSHSCSHPFRMSHCSLAQISYEWRESRKALSDILGEEIFTASVPGGFYSQAVAAAAAEAGFKILFTSEPTTRSHEVNGCLILGRYSIRQRTAPHLAAGLAAGHLAPSMQQAIMWNAKKVTKSLGGAYWFKIRKSILDRKAASHQKI